jgi:hypothetical protein
MAWPNPFRKRDKYTRTYWGFTFQLTDEHLTAEASQPLKYSYDKLGEECLNILNDIDAQTKVENASAGSDSSAAGKPRSLKPKRDLYRLLESHANDHPKLQELWAHLNTVPEWVDWDQVLLF